MKHKIYHKAILASAGTGKTYSLVQNYIETLFGLDESGVKKRPSEILALTFTQKAANEMRIRVAQRLQDLLAGNISDSDPLFKKAKDFNTNILDHDYIKKVLRSLPNAWISTFHGFCLTLLKDNLKEAKLLEPISIMSSQEELRLAQNVLRPIIINEIKTNNKTLKSLVSRFRLGKGLMSLGLIEGIIHAYLGMFEKGIHLEHIADHLAHNKTTANEITHESLKMASAIDSFIKLHNNTSKTKEKLAIVNNSYIKFHESLKSNDEELISYHFSQLRKAASGNFGNKEYRQELVKHIVSCGALLVDYFLQDDNNELLTILKTFHEKFFQIKHDLGVLTFSDLLIKTRNLLMNNAKIRRKLKLQIKHILIDEYQDTSPIQEDIISLLAENKNNEARNWKNMSLLSQIDFKEGASLFLVGDKKQSIYGFRGADINLFDKMIKKISGLKNKVFIEHLNINRRSNENILSLVNLVARNTLSLQGYQEHENLKPFRNNSKGECGLWVNNEEKETDKLHANLSCAAHGIRIFLNNDDQLKAGDIAILVRRIKSATFLKSELKRLSINSRVIGGEGFYERQEIIDILCALKLVCDPGCTYSIAVSLRSYLVLLKDKEILHIFEKSKNQHEILSLSYLKEFLDKNVLTKNSNTRLKQFIKAIHYIRENVSFYGLPWALDHLLLTCDYTFSLALIDEPEQCYQNLKKLRNLFILEHDDPFLSIENFHKRIFDKPREPIAPLNNESDAVKIMTIHQSKGLEFPCVVLADLESPIRYDHSDFLIDRKLGLRAKPKGRAVSFCAPSSTDKKLKKTSFDKIHEDIKEKSIFEEARLLYVALTRAKEKLFIASSQSGFKNKRQTTLLSMFLKAREHEKVEFNLLCPLNYIDTKIENVGVREKISMNKQGVLYKEEYLLKRIYASALSTQNFANLDLSFLNLDLKSINQTINGDYAHKLIQYSGAMMARMKEFDELSIQHFIDSSARFLANKYNRDQQTEKAVFKTLIVLKEHFIDAKQIIFEMPLMTQMQNFAVLEGFADLVIERDSFVLVLDFKASSRLYSHKDTFIQLFAYAYSLSKRFNKPIKFAPVLIGNRQKILINNFNNKCLELLQEVVHHHVQNRP